MNGAVDFAGSGILPVRFGPRTRKVDDLNKHGLGLVAAGFALLTTTLSSAAAPLPPPTHPRCSFDADHDVDLLAIDTPAPAGEAPLTARLVLLDGITLVGDAPEPEVPVGGGKPPGGAGDPLNIAGPDGAAFVVVPRRCDGAGCLSAEVLRRDSSGGETFTSIETAQAALSTGSTLVGAIDVNEDQSADLAWQGPPAGGLAGSVTFWLRPLNPTPTAIPVTTPAGAWPDANWKVIGTGRFDPSARPYLLWRHAVSGALVWWRLAFTASGGIEQVDGGYLTPGALPDANWRLVSIADFDGDDKDDLLWQHQISHRLAVWYMDGTTRLDGTLLDYTPAPDHWRIAGPR